MAPRLLLVDGFNLFYANYYVNTKQNQNGEPIGGFLGFLNQLRNIISKFSPQQVIITFDGPDAGYRRRQEFKEYKGKRARKERCARIPLSEKGEEKDEIKVNNEQEQLKKLFDALKLLPVKIAIVPYYEADDVIGHLAIKNAEYEVIIVSSDKDYLQLINENVSCYQPFKQRMITINNFQETYNVLQQNYLFSRTICGDVSDAFKGVKGVSNKTLIKLLPEITSINFEDFESFWGAIKNIEGDSKMITKLKEGYKESLNNFKLMRLGDTLNLKAIESLQLQLDQQENKPFSKLALKIYYAKNELNQEIPHYESWINPFIFVNKIPLKLKA